MLLLYILICSSIANTVILYLIYRKQSKYITIDTVDDTPDSDEFYDDPDFWKKK